LSKPGGLREGNSMTLPKPTLDRLKTQHEIIRVLISGLNESELTHRPIPDKWSMKENITHLTCYQPRVIFRINKILSEDNPTFAGYVPEDDPEFSKFLSMGVDELLAHQKEKRAEIVNIITSLSEEQLKRTGTHSKFGRMNIVEWTEFFLLHEAHHIYTIFKLVRSIKK
jgi:hypothetical protein